MTRKIQSIQSTNTATTVSVPIGARIHSVRGESSTKPTYDFTVIHSTWSSISGTAVSYSTKYCGGKNGSVTNLWHEFPALVTTGNAPAAAAQEQITVTAGTGVALQVYYVFGLVSSS